MELEFDSEVNYQINERVQGKTDFFRQTFITIDLLTKWNEFYDPKIIFQSLFSFEF